jgi:SAM-dependent methyltransferase
MTIDFEDAVAVGGLSVRLLRPSEPEELFAVAADARGDAPYWAELWPCARSLAAHLASLDLKGMRVLELGCGLALPSLVAALRGADVLASDVSADALERVAESGRRTLGRPLATLQADLHEPSALLASGPFDLVLGADLLYDCTLASAMGALIPQIAPAALFAYAWQGSAIPLAVPLAAQGYRIAQWRPGAAGPRLFEAVRGHRVGHRARDAHHALAVAHHDVARHDEHLGAADGDVFVHRHVAHDVGGRGGAERIDGEAELLHRRIVADAPVEDEPGRAAHLQARDEDVPRIRGAGHAAAIHHEDLPALDVLDGVPLRIAGIGQHLVPRAVLTCGGKAHGDRLARHALVRAERPHAVQVHVAEAELEELGAERGRRDLPEPLEGVGPEWRQRRGRRSHCGYAGIWSPR